MKTTTLPLSHLLLALAIVAIWGTNFVVMKNCLAVFPPFMFAALRYSFALLPMAFFIPRPKVPLWNLALYGVLIGVGQFGIVYYAVNSQISPGLASLVIQTQVFFTIGFAMLLNKERLRLYQVFALLLALIGLLIIALHTDATTTLLGLALMVFAGFSWGAANTVGRYAGISRPADLFAYVVWASAFAVPPLLLISAVFEGGVAHLSQILEQAPLGTWLGVLWQSWGNTLFGYAAWAWLLSKHPAAVVAPMPLLVPIFGMGASAIYLGEDLPVWKLFAAGLVMVGLLINVSWPRLKQQITKVIKIT
ncbi:EamA family transporter [Polynucleobacter paneuropaeus]|nr:EamA family transporter [Polynucleobacter paneuropaeus]MBT8617386.1 EamA family transporter [Polynucleobacter paneuropaeus]MBT8619268.1 EamA family transporter [Polynucleobacter paneuropaeus]MBT8621152.1 EamA family transporter [Polynucleobacter paneuropaeus]MBT8626683.1 EamA family transporter [Polynucleobacter paneuropaeus]